MMKTPYFLLAMLPHTNQCHQEHWQSGYQIFYTKQVFRHHLQTGPGPKRRASKNQTLILRTLEKTEPRNLVETKDQIEYISRYSNSAKNKDQNFNIPRKAGSSELTKSFLR